MEQTLSIEAEEVSMAKIPSDVSALFSSDLVARKRRISLLVKWFKQNYHLWWITTADSNYLPLSNIQFAAALTVSLSEFRIEIQPQRVWTWLKERNLPRPDSLQVMADIADEGSWQREFARIALEILNSGEPE